MQHNKLHPLKVKTSAINYINTHVSKKRQIFNRFIKLSKLFRHVGT